ncbi:methylated-DNA--[protein]-cysteine S-methyltransferase [Noviherbaspirillum saxi]|uniref:Methylated-DNA--protein-cysteine methyltransferase n=1 Tax=Noviherbaspirillum saxi TaxID=2320863 RepID=A0A3A3FTD6_9BURK|nr:methylated-DNA--[protein]-cysteine S-methyltransferase [Noviherbaspirillum saxi]RJF97451.1 methylated-DNA--[protein]-cysteine S-methyltransferase [Noviherbaspirillum saxi]
MTCYTEYHSPLGILLLAATERGLSGLYFEEHRYFKGTRDWRRDATHPHLMRTMAQLDEYFAGRRRVFDVPLDMAGTPFQGAVWNALMSLPYGSTSTYQAIAQRIANPKAIRAAGTAIGRNPVSIIVPCHRVLGVSGALSGYAGGVERKSFLLELESSSHGKQALLQGMIAG